MEIEAGIMKEGLLVDLLLVDGDLVADMNLLHSKQYLVAILKVGQIHTLDQAGLLRQQLRAAE